MLSAVGIINRSMSCSIIPDVAQQRHYTRAAFSQEIMEMISNKMLSASIHDSVCCWFCCYVILSLNRSCGCFVAAPCFQMKRRPSKFKNKISFLVIRQVGQSVPGAYSSIDDSSTDSSTRLYKSRRGAHLSARLELEVESIGEAAGVRVLRVIALHATALAIDPFLEPALCCMGIMSRNR